MKYQPGKYIIIKPTFWTHSKATTLTIIKVDEKNKELTYQYDEESFKRYRSFDDFECLLLIEYTPLMEELL